MYNLYNLTLICLCLGIILSMMSVVAIVTNNKLGKQLAMVQNISVNDNYMLDYEKDIIFFDAILEELVSNTIITLKLAQVKTLTNKEFKKLVAETSVNIYKRMSPQYLRRMQRYFSEDGFNDFINDRVMISWTSATMLVMDESLKEKNSRAVI